MSIFTRRSTLFPLAGLWLALVIPAAAQAAVPHNGGSPGEVSLDLLPCMTFREAGLLAQLSYAGMNSSSRDS